MGRRPKNTVKYKVPENTYLHIEAFMVNDLHLSGNELIIYAAIFGFSQDGSSWFTGSRKYLGGWCQITDETVTYNLNKLLKKGLIECREKKVHDVVFKDYRAIPVILGGTEKSVPPDEKPVPDPEKPSHPTEKTHPHTIVHTIDSYDSSHTIGDTPAQNPKKRFRKPSLEEVTAYCKERKNSIDPQYFIDYQETRGWRLKGGQPMRDWKAAIRTWERMDGKFSQRKPAQQKLDLSEPRIGSMKTDNRSGRTEVYKGNGVWEEYVSDYVPQEGDVDIDF